MADESSDRHYDLDIEQVFQELSDASNLLEQCKSLKSASELNRNFELKGANNSNFSTLFQNIDGNRSNFNNFAVHIYKFKHKFSVIGLAETNINPENKNLFMLEEYQNFYQDMNLAKSKGTGVALYIHNSLCAKEDKFLSQCSDNLESLFVKFKIGAEEHTVGVVYNPPSGDKVKFVSELESILKKCTPRNLHILGDFNINLHKLEGETAKTYEDLILSHGLFPLISNPTHLKPGCQPICIDNIFTSNISSVLSSGTIAFGLSHHHSIFQLTDQSHETLNKVATVQYYDFSNSKTDKFLESIDQTFGIYDKINLQQFLSIYDNKINEFFKLTSPKMSRRNRKCNPWITDGLIISFERKSLLYVDWDDTKTKKNPGGDRKLHEKYSNYRRSLKHTINAAKDKYYGKKFKQNEGNLKKNLGTD